MRPLLYIVLVAGCARTPPQEPLAADATSRARTYVACDPVKTIARMRKNAASVGCKVTERSSGTMISCGDAELWIVPDPKGLEVTCTGLHLNCSQRGRQLLRAEESE